MSTEAGTEQSRLDACVDCLCSLVAKFCSLIVAFSMTVGGIVYIIGVAKLTHSWGSMDRIVVAHFCAMISTFLANVCYIYLFLRGQKQVQFMSVLSTLLLISFMLVAHSIGVAAPNVVDCGSNFTVVSDTFGETAGNAVNGAVKTITNKTLNTTVLIWHGRGSYDQSLVGCHDQAIVLGGAIVVGFFQLVAIFDVQRVLLRRVRSKTYGEIFVEMGISSAGPK